MPFILRSVNLIGINAEKSTKYERKVVWEKIAALKKEKGIKQIYKIIKFKDIINSINDISKNKSSGRVTVKF